MVFDRKGPRGPGAVIGSSMAIFWPGALIFGLPGVMGPYWMEIFHVGRGAIGNILFFVLAAVGCFMFPVGRWQERFGIRWMITFGVILCGLNGLTIAYASNLYMLYLWAFLTGASSAFIYIPAVTTVQRWYPMRRGLAAGIVNLVFGFSATIMSPLFRYLSESLGYVSMNLLVAASALVIGGVAAQFTDGPETSAVSQNQSSIEGMGVKESVRTKNFWLLWLVWAFQGAAGIAMVVLSTAYALSRGFSMESAVTILMAFNFTNGGSRIVTGFLSDIVGRSRVMSITFFAAGLAYFILPHTDTVFTSAVPAAFIGFAFGTLFAVSAPLAVDCFGLKHFGAIFGLNFTAYGFVAGMLGPSLSGYLLDITRGNFLVVFTYLGVFCILSGFLTRLITPPRPKNESTEGQEAGTIRTSFGRHPGQYKS